MAETWRLTAFYAEGKRERFTFDREPQLEEAASGRPFYRVYDPQTYKNVLLPEHGLRSLELERDEEEEDLR